MSLHFINQWVIRPLRFTNYWVIRFLQIIFAAVVLVLSSILVANQPAGKPPAQVIYNIAVSGFSLLTGVVLSCRLRFGRRDIGLGWIVIMLDSMNVLLLLSAAITMEVTLGVDGCGGVNDIFGSWPRCSEAKATTVVLWLGRSSCMIFANFRICYVQSLFAYHRQYRLDSVLKVIFWAANLPTTTPHSRHDPEGSRIRNYPTLPPV